MKTSASTSSDGEVPSRRGWRQTARFWLAWGGLLLALGSAGCAKVGPPVPPPRFTLAAAGEPAATQYGDQIVVRFVATDRAARADILRRIEPRNAPLALPEDRFVQDARLIGSLTGQELSSGAGPAYVDAFDPQDTSWKDKRIRYAIRLVDARGRPSPLSGYAMVYPALSVAQPPRDVQATVTQEAIRLQWQPPEQNLDASPATEVRFNVYRRAAGSALESRRNGAPLPTPQFAETDFTFGEEYEYVVRAVSYVQGAPVESRPSPALRIRPVDTFPPAAPTNVTGASAAGIVNLFFPSSPETDLRGYIIYRSERGTNLPPTRLTPTPIQRTTFQDLTGVRGRVYLYFVTAVDVFGNESERSQPVEVEVVP
ncbi:fibronectin type III domain-containing protein [Chloracidobacterium sp. MS 40/45]|uniref:fibronectin type III domain-containing protein n=1 Tax=Chloracidobacterium aggregatum TaxID=2851959 RepID=UPI001B8BA437|nr:fibronectin type III domain-containing protein [Chloracidobacterium aggregatum]QUW00097.1 fibronectin type III domain-containing protein [Chloracidobacterium sp. MS 40/45]